MNKNIKNLSFITGSYRGNKLKRQRNQEVRDLYEMQIPDKRIAMSIVPADLAANKAFQIGNYDDGAIKYAMTDEQLMNESTNYLPVVNSPKEPDYLTGGLKPSKPNPFSITTAINELARRTGTAVEDIGKMTNSTRVGSNDYEALQRAKEIIRVAYPNYVISDKPNEEEVNDILSLANLLIKLPPQTYQPTGGTATCPEGWVRDANGLCFPKTPTPATPTAPSQLETEAIKKLEKNQSFTNGLLIGGGVLFALFAIIAIIYIILNKD